MQSEQASKRNQRFKNIRSSLQKLPLISSKTNNINQKMIKRSESSKFSEDIDTQATSPQTHITDQTGFQEKYQIGQKIGEGAIGVVRKCVHKFTEKTYAVKCIRIDEQQRRHFKEQFINIRSLDHPNIIGYKALYLDYKKNAAYLVMDYETMPSLKEVKDLDESDIKHIMKELLSTIQYIHSKKICHRDIKPQNILYDPQSKKIKLIDFGTSKNFNKRNQRVDMLTITGTLYYRAPEMFVGAGYDERVDLWSCGITLYNLITRTTPFESNYHHQTIKNIVEGNVSFEDPIWDYYSKFARDLVVHLIKPKEERLTATEAKRHLWFSEEGENFELLLTHSDSLSMMRRHSLTKQSHNEDYVFHRSEMTDGKSMQNAEKIRSQLKKWIVNKDENSVVIEMEEDEEEKPARKLNYPSQ